MIELIERRQENSKTFDLGNGQRQLEISTDFIHYKDDYADQSEQWKDIDLTWVGNRITKAPYELTLEGNKLTIKNKKNGEISTIELNSIGRNKTTKPSWIFSKGFAKVKDFAQDTDLEIEAANSRIKFTRVLKSSEAPIEAKFQIKGTFRVYARDTEMSLPVNVVLKNGVLTETLVPDRTVKYPVRIDPTWQPGQSSDCVWRRNTPHVWLFNHVEQIAGGQASNDFGYGGGMRFPNVTIPQGATIDTTKLTFMSSQSRSGTGCKTRISAEDIDDAATFVDDTNVFTTRWNARTSARVDWDNIVTWNDNTEYDSPECKTVEQELVDRQGWVSGQDQVWFWEDFAERSVVASNNIRIADSYLGSAADAPKLVVTYSVFLADAVWDFFTWG